MEKNAAAIQSAAQPPGRRVRLRRRPRRDDRPAAEQAQRAQLAPVDPVGNRPGRFQKVKTGRAAGRDPVPLDRDQPPHLVRTAGHRFFRQQVFARPQGLHPQRNAKTGRQRQHHSLDPRISQQLCAAVVDCPYRIGSGSLLRQRPLHVSDGRQLDLIGGRGRLRVGRADRSATDDAEL